MRFFFIILLLSLPLHAEKKIGEESGKFLPRFISLKSSESNLRVGPSTEYPIILKYIKKNMPLKVIDEQKNWRKIIDINNNEGWLHISLLSNKRFGIIIKTDGDYINVYNNPDGIIKGSIGINNIIKLKKCNDKWCFFTNKNYKGWLKKANIWGVFIDEKFD